MRVELERQEAESRQRMAAELAKKTRQADEQLNEQRDLYEDRLAELNDLLVSLGFVKKKGGEFWFCKKNCKKKGGESWFCKKKRGKGMFLYSAVSSRLDRSKRFSLFLPRQTCSFRHHLGFSWKRSGDGAITHED